jgi:peptidoglycan/LPS O-acetylase OafA/YrhL
LGLLRFVLAYSVVIGHMGTAFPGKLMNGGLAVQAFFIISGFYMAMVLDGKYASQRLFYENRLLRLFPTYFVVLFLSAIVFFVFSLSLFVKRDVVVTALFTSPQGWAVLFSNFFILGQDVITWTSYKISNGAWDWNTTAKYTSGTIASWRLLLVPQAWSLSLELMFYALAPFLARRSLLVLVLVFSASVVIRWLGDVWGFPYFLYPRRFFPAELCLFIAGMLAYRLRELADRVPTRADKAILVLVLGVTLLHSYIPLPVEWGRTLIYAGVAAALPILFRVSAASSVDRFVGDLSYPIYIVHILVLTVAKQWLGVHWSVTVLLVLVASVLLLLLVDRPVDRWRQERVARRREKSVGGGHSPSPAAISEGAS